MIKPKILIPILFFSIFFACEKDPIRNGECMEIIDLLEDSFSYEIILPDHVIRAVRSGGYYDESLNLIDLPSNSTVESFIDNNKAALGRVLFYDKNLSKNGTVSCGSCHIQQNSFAEARSIAKGINEQIGSRNTMNLENVIFYPSAGGYGWGEGSALLENQIKAAILNLKEMDMTEADLITAVQENCNYEASFLLAYGDFDISTSEIYDALAHFVGSMTSYNSKYDIGRADVNSADVDFPNFNPLENAGKSLFISHCATCHIMETFRGAVPVNIGLDLEYLDKGLGHVTGNPDDFGKFKTPSLRNITASAPYMHDGRFNDLDEVINFYSDSIANHVNLDFRLRDAEEMAIKFEFADFEKVQLKAFLQTLTDDQFLNEPKFSDPFQ